MNQIGIRSIASYLPEKILTNEELVKRLGFSRDFLGEKLGIKERRVAAAEEACSDVACEAVGRLFRESPGLRREDVDLLIVCTQNPDYKLPHTAAIVQHRLGLRNDLASFDINLGCSGFVYSLAVAQSLMATSGMQNGLIVTADLYSKIMNPVDRATVPIFGDAASVVWVGCGSNNSIGRFAFGTDGDGYDKLIVQRGGTRMPWDNMPEGSEDPEELVRTRHLHMNGRAIFEFMMKRIPSDVKKCLELNDRCMEDVDYFVFHQASAYMLNSLRDYMGIPEKKVPILLGETGNTVSSTIPMALEWLIRTGRSPGSTVFISGFGAGLSWASTLLTFAK